MVQATFAFQGDLNFFLGRENRDREIPLTFADHQSIKHLIEALGVPHVEVGRVLADGQAVGMDDRPTNGARILVQPAAPATPPEARFLLDIHLGRLAGMLRMLGFDSLYRNDFSDDQIADCLEQEARILLTRDRRLLMRKVVRSGYCLRSLDPATQLGEVVARFQLDRITVPFRRCLVCNQLLEQVEKNTVLGKLEPKTILYYNEFVLCPGCHRVYWRGSHYQHMRELVDQIIAGDRHG